MSEGTLLLWLGNGGVHLWVVCCMWVWRGRAEQSITESKWYSLDLTQGCVQKNTYMLYEKKMQVGP